MKKTTKKRIKTTKTGKPNYPSKLNELKIAIANEVFTGRKVRKTPLRNLYNASSQTFGEAVQWLVDMRFIKEEYLPKLITKEQKRNVRQQLYLSWIGNQPPGITTDIRELISFEEIDLSNYPIRELSILDDVQILFLKKFIWKMNNNLSKLSVNRYNKFYEFLQVEIGMPEHGIRPALSYKKKDLYEAVRRAIAVGKIDLGMDDNAVVFYKNIEYLLHKKQWKCDNCDNRNPGRFKFCGECGDKRCQSGKNEQSEN